MARCLKNESSMRRVFYGTMIAEGAIALVWAGAASGYYGSTDVLSAVVAAGGPGQVVHEVCTAMMGTLGGVLAVLGVVVLPITSGDTAFRVGRLIVADGIGLDQRRARNRYMVALPLFAAAVILNFVDFTLIWRYFGWANQALAAVTLWTGTVFLARRGRKWWIAAVPAVFMTVMTTTYILVEERGLALNLSLGTGIGISVGLIALIAFFLLRPAPGSDHDDAPPRSEDEKDISDGCQVC
jgi:carbon starvation protein CstA